MLYELDGVTPQLDENAWAAPDAAVIGDVHMMTESSVWFGAVIRGDMEQLVIGARSNIQDGSVLHTDEGVAMIVGSGVTVGHKVILHGCRIADNVLVGMGSVIMNGASIGAHTIIGAGSLIPEGKEIPGGVLAFGAPAQVKRPLSDEEKALIRWSADHYVKNAAKYHAGLVAVAQSDPAAD